MSCALGQFRRTLAIRAIILFACPPYGPEEESSSRHGKHSNDGLGRQIDPALHSWLRDLVGTETNERQKDAGSETDNLSRDWWSTPNPTGALAATPVAVLWVKSLETRAGHTDSFSQTR